MGDKMGVDLVRIEPVFACVRGMAVKVFLPSCFWRILRDCCSRKAFGSGAVHVSAESNSGHSGWPSNTAARPKSAS